MQNIVLPFSGISAEVRGMTGVEEDLFGDETKQRDGRALNHTLKNCTLSLDGEKPTYTDIVNLKTPDRVELMLRIRHETYGAQVVSKVTCPGCKKSYPIELSIDDAETFPKTRKDFTDEGHYDIELSDGTIVTYELLDGSKEATLSKAPKAELLTIALLLPLVRVVNADGTDLPDNDKKKWLKNMPLKLRQEIRDAMKDHMLGTDTGFVFTCPDCGNETEGVMEQLMPGFFFPSKPKSEETAK